MFTSVRSNNYWHWGVKNWKISPYGKGQILDRIAMWNLIKHTNRPIQSVRDDDYQEKDRIRRIQRL